MEIKDYSKLTDEELIRVENDMLEGLEIDTSMDGSGELGYKIYQSYEPHLKAIEREYQNRGLFDIPIDEGDVGMPM